LCEVGPKKKKNRLAKNQAILEYSEETKGNPEKVIKCPGVVSGKPVGNTLKSSVEKKRQKPGGQKGILNAGPRGWRTAQVNIFGPSEH